MVQKFKEPFWTTVCNRKEKFSSLSFLGKSIGYFLLVCKILCAPQVDTLGTQRATIQLSKFFCHSDGNLSDQKLQQAKAISIHEDFHQSEKNGSDWDKNSVLRVAVVAGFWQVCLLRTTLFEESVFFFFLGQDRNKGFEGETSRFYR